MLLFLVGCPEFLGCTQEEPQKTPLGLELSQGDVSLGDPSLSWPGVVGVPNLDDDDGDGVRDWDQGLEEDDDDYTTFLVVPGDSAVRLTLVEGEDEVRVYRDGDVVLEEDDDELVLKRSEGSVELQVEYRSFLSVGLIAVEEAASGEILDLYLTAAPLILNHHLQPAELVMMMRVYYGPGVDNNSMVNQYKDALGADRFLRIDPGDYDWDVWVQDEIEFATLDSTDGHIDVIIDSIRNGQGQAGSGLDNLAEDEFSRPDWVVRTWGDGQATGQDFFGNLEVSPPVTVDDVLYPFGRIYYGSTTEQYKPNAELEDFLDSQKVQAPFKLDTSWLIVGHVDEYSSTIPDPSSEKGFKFLMADTRVAWELLESADPETELTRYALKPPYYGHDIATIGEMLDDTSLRAVNEDVQDILDSELEKFRVGLGLEDEDIILVPTLFHEEYSGWDAVVALTPGMVNLIVAEDLDGVPTLFTPDPMLRTDIDSTDGDPFVAYMEEVLPEELRIEWMDDWFVYHMGLGEVHCGSNVVRPSADALWWEDATHLLTEED